MSKHCDKEACQHLSLKVASLIMYLSTPWYVSMYTYNGLGLGLQQDFFFKTCVIDNIQKSYYLKLMFYCVFSKKYDFCLRGYFIYSCILPWSNEVPVTEGVVVSISYTSRVVNRCSRSYPRHPYNMFKIDGVFLKLA